MFQNSVFRYQYISKCYSSVDVVAGYGIDGEVRFPAGVRDFYRLHSVHTGSEVHPVSTPVGTGGFFSCGKAAGV
jgi:hypothetical protein